MVSVNARLTDETCVSNSFDKGLRNTLHAYTAPSATWMATPAAAMTQRFPTLAATTPPSLALSRCKAQLPPAPMWQTSHGSIRAALHVARQAHEGTGGPLRLAC